MINVIIWGTGRYAEEFVNKIDNNNSKISIRGFVESRKTKNSYRGIPVYEADYLLKLNYDYIIVANSFAAEIKNLCVELNIKLDNIIWLHVPRDNREFLHNTTGIERIIPNFGLNYCCNYNEVLIPSRIEENEEYAADYLLDYVRFKTFDLITEDLDNLEGDVAEVGVFQGNFAKHINRRFPNKKLYLFDTFEGFDIQEAQDELIAGHCDEGFIEYYKHGSEEITLSKMKNRSNCIIKKGLFPDSLNGLERKFVFVSIDVDFEQSIYEGLKYFYPRMVKGGYIFIHDYNTQLKGVKKAVDRYENDYGKFSKIPITDGGGTLVVVK